MAIEFTRKHLHPALHPSHWQQPPHDRVLRDSETRDEAFFTVANYILENPVRAGLVEKWSDYPFLGCNVAGYPDLDIRRRGYWELFWRIRHRLIRLP